MDHRQVPSDRDARIVARTDHPIEGCSVVPDVVAFAGLPERGESIALDFPGPRTGRRLVRMHSCCVTGDGLGSLRCDCGRQKREGIERCAEEGGIFLYLDQEGRGIGLRAKIEAYALQRDLGLDTYAANRTLGFPDDLRDYRAAATMLRLLGATRIRLLTGSPAKLEALNALGIDALAEFSATFVNQHNLAYLAAKRRAGHRLTLGDDLG